MGAPQLHLQEPRPPRLLLLKQQSGSERPGRRGGRCVCVGGMRGGSYGDSPQQPWHKPGSSWSPEEGSPRHFPGKKTEAEGGWLEGPSWDLSLHFTLPSRPYGCTGFAWGTSVKPWEAVQGGPPGEQGLHSSPTARGGRLGRAPPGSGGFSDRIGPSGAAEIRPGPPMRAPDPAPGPSASSPRRGTRGLSFPDP